MKLNTPNPVAISLVYNKSKFEKRNFEEHELIVAALKDEEKEELIICRNENETLSALIDCLNFKQYSPLIFFDGEKTIISLKSKLKKYGIKEKKVFNHIIDYKRKFSDSNLHMKQLSELIQLNKPRAIYDLPGDELLYFMNDKWREYLLEDVRIIWKFYEAEKIMNMEILCTSKIINCDKTNLAKGETKCQK